MGPAGRTLTDELSPCKNYSSNCRLHLQAPAVALNIAGDERFSVKIGFHGAQWNGRWKGGRSWLMSAGRERAGNKPVKIYLFGARSLTGFSRGSPFIRLADFDYNCGHCDKDLLHSFSLVAWPLWDFSQVERITRFDANLPPMSRKSGLPLRRFAHRNAIRRLNGGLRSGGGWLGDRPRARFRLYYFDYGHYGNSSLIPKCSEYHANANETALQMKSILPARTSAWNRIIILEM